MNGAGTHSQSGSNFSVFVLMLLLNFIAGLDYGGIVEHSIKAVVTALIWLTFKILADHISKKQKSKGEKLE